MNARIFSPTILLLLIGLLALIFLLAALGLFLLQAPPEQLPETSTASPSAASTARPAGSATESQPSSTPRTSYTPFANRLTQTLNTTERPATKAPTMPATPTITLGSGTPSPTSIPITPYPGPGTALPSPTISSTSTVVPTATLSSGEFGVSGRVVQSGVPLAGITVEFRDDQPVRTAVTDAEGRYWFKSFAIGANFTLTFIQAANPQLSTSTQIASTALLYGYLPSGSQIITLPDLEVSLVVNGQIFEASTPLDGAAFNTTNITPANPIQFVWTTYSQADYYYVELTIPETDELIWSSENTTSTNTMFNGTLDDNTHITAGSYYWMVAASRPTGGYQLIAYTHPHTLIINP